MMGVKATDIEISIGLALGMFLLVVIQGYLLALVRRLRVHWIHSLEHL